MRNTTLPSPNPVTHFIAATMATIIAIGLLASVATLFQRDGLPMRRLLLAERACSEYRYVSERDACMRQWLAATRTLSTASQ